MTSGPRERQSLAVVVTKSDVERVLASLKSEGVYDDSRRIRERDSATIEIPVTESPETCEVKTVIEQSAPDRRLIGVTDHLREAGWSESELARVPQSWAVVGDVILVRFTEECPRWEEVGEALLHLHGADTVLHRRGIVGGSRIPDVEVVVGDGDTEVVHVEHGTKYALDLSSVMFSPGNKAERVRMGDSVVTGERVLDMFAGIGYFTLPMARAGAEVTAIERNPEAFQYLIENTVLNGIEDRVTPLLGDCRDIIDWYRKSSTPVNRPIENRVFHRVVMGYYDAGEYLDEAIPVVEPNGIIHFHALVGEEEIWGTPISQLEAATNRAQRELDIVERRIVKSHASRVYHVVIDAQIQ